MKEYEKYLKEIYDDFKSKKAEKIKIVCRDSIQKANLDYLIDNGLVKSTGIQNWMDGSTHYYLVPTYDGLHYEEIKDEFNNKQIQNISNIYNNYNGKVNINSIDNSVRTNNNYDVFEKMIAVINKQNIDNKEDILKAINELKKFDGKSEFKDKLVDFLQISANIMTIISPFIGNLLKMC